MNHETFWTLLHDIAHWEFELFLQLIFDVIIAGLLWPLARKHWQHHIARDQRDMTYNWSMNPVAKSAGHAIETPEGFCDGCGGVKAALDGVDLCTGCGDLRVQRRAEKVFLVPSDNSDNGWPSFE